MSQLRKWITFIQSAFYPWWCKLLQRMKGQHKDRRYLPQWRNLTPRQTASLLRLLEWRADGVKQGFDSVRHPANTSRLINAVIRNNHHPPGAMFRMMHEQPGEAIDIIGRLRPMKGIGALTGFDCDDHAAFAEYALQARYSPRMVAITWREGRKRKGHMFCAYRSDAGGWCAVDNAELREPQMPTVHKLARFVAAQHGADPDTLTIHAYKPGELYV
jgi:hypothetical protein